MREFSASVAIFLLCSSAQLGCAKKHEVIDGGVVNGDGWPHRPATHRVRCPTSTFLVDEMSQSGRRSVLCRSLDSANPRGFELTWDPDGQLVSRLDLTDDGKPIARTQWFDDGSVAAEEEYREGRLMRKVGYYPTGKTRADIAYDASRDVTLVQRFGPDGSIEEKGEMRNGRLIGTWQEWREGALETLQYVDGVAQGTVERVYPSGGVERGRYEDGLRAGKWIRIDERDIPVTEISYREGKRNGAYRAYHPNSQIKEEGTFLNDQKHEQWRSWFASGELVAEVWFACGVPTGPYKTYHRDGSPHIVGLYEIGKKVGEWKTFNEEGIATAIRQYQAPQSEFTPDGLPDECPGN